jgi:hypothetical protein
LLFETWRGDTPQLDVTSALSLARGDSGLSSSLDLGYGHDRPIGIAALLLHDRLEREQGVVTLERSNYTLKSYKENVSTG